MRIFKVYFGITRSYAPMLMCVGALIGMLISKGAELTLWEALTPLTSLYFLTSASFVFNDIFDLETDRVNRIDRPLVSGELSVKAAWILWAILTASGLGLLSFLKYREAALLLVFSYGLSLLYTVKIKGYGLLGNILVSLLVSFSLIYGALSVSGSFPLTMFSFVFLAFLLNLAREVIQGISDAPGDALKDVRSVSRRYGVRAAKILGMALVVMMLVSAPVIVKASGAEFFRNQAVIYGYTLITAGFTYVLYRLWRVKQDEIRKVLTMINILTVALIALIIISVAV